MIPSCQYICKVHKGKIEWHHPISWVPRVGLYLCELHHSIIQGRKKRDDCELVLDKSLDEMRIDLLRLEKMAVEKAGINPDCIDKH